MEKKTESILKERDEILKIFLNHDNAAISFNFIQGIILEESGKDIDPSKLKRILERLLEDGLIKIQPVNAFYQVRYTEKEKILVDHFRMTEKAREFNGYYETYKKEIRNRRLKNSGIIVPILISLIAIIAPIYYTGKSNEILEFRIDTMRKKVQLLQTTIYKNEAKIDSLDSLSLIFRTPFIDSLIKTVHGPVHPDTSNNGK